MTCKTVAKRIKGKTPEQIRRTLKNELPVGKLQVVFECMLGVTNDLAVLYALAQV